MPNFFSHQQYKIALISPFMLLLITGQLFAQSADSHTMNPFTYVLQDTLVQSDVTHLTRALEDNYERVKSQLQVPVLPIITVQIWSDEEAYQHAMQQTLGMRFPGSRGYVTGDRELRLLYHRRLSAQKEAVHEFAHVVSLNLNPSFGNNPRWLWEAVAMYAAEEFRDPKEVSYLRDGNYPSLSDLNAGFNSGKNIYDVGYLLIDYVVTRWNTDALIELILSNGDIPSTLDVSETDFEAGWRAFVIQNHMSP